MPTFGRGTKKRIVNFVTKRINFVAKNDKKVLTNGEACGIIKAQSRGRRPTPKEKKDMKDIKQIREELNALKTRSAWKRGVKEYALDLLERFEEFAFYAMAKSEEPPKLDRATLLDGAENWQEYSYIGNALIYNTDIARRLCAPYELKKTRNGERRPNSSEEWVDVQARALAQAEKLLYSFAY